MKKTLLIEDFEDKETKANKAYTRFKTSEGWMSCFDSASNLELKKCTGFSVEVEVKESGGFTNIQKFIGKVEGDEKVETPQSGNVVPKSGNFPLSMKVSYAKDLFLGLVNEDPKSRMETAIRLIKQAEEAFK